MTILRVFMIYRPLVMFFWSGTLLSLIGVVVGLRFLAHYLSGNGASHTQSLILAALCLILGGLLFMIELIAELISANRKLLEHVHLRLQHLQHGQRSVMTEDGSSQAICRNRSNPTHASGPIARALRPPIPRRFRNEHKAHDRPVARLDPHLDVGGLRAR